MRRMLKLPLLAAGTALTLVLLLTIALLATAVTAFFYPGVVLNPATLRVAAAAASVKGLFVKWDEATVDASSDKVWQKRLAFDLRNVCVQMPSVNLSTCLPRVAAALAVDVHPDHPRLLSLGPVTVEGDQLSFGPMPESSKEPSEPIDWIHLKRPEWLRGMQLAPATGKLASGDSAVAWRAF